MKKNSESKAIRKQLISQFYRNNKIRFYVAMAVTLISSLANLVFSWLLQAVLDTATGADGTIPLTTLITIAIVLYGVLAVLCFIQYHTQPAFIAKAMQQYKDHVFERLSQKGITAFSGENSSLYTSALSNDAASIERNYLESSFSLATHILLFTGAFAMMLWYSPMLTLATIGFSVVPVIASILTGSRIAKAEKVLSDRNESYLGTLKDCLTGFSVIKSFKAEKQAIALMSQTCAQAAQAKCRRDKIAVVVSAIGLAAGSITQFGVFFFSAYLALSGKGITPGVIILFVQLINFVISPIGEVPGLLAQRKAAKELIGKMADALSKNIREEEKTVEAHLDDCIEIRDLRFSYEDGSEILSGINTRFEAGKSYAIVGASGSGKSTLLNLLMASHDDYEGSISYDGTELRSISSQSLYGLASMVQQNVFVFNASIRDNITMFSSFPEHEIDRAIQLSGLSALIAERGEDYLCGENGSGLSGGEKQRISIARSLLRRSSLLLVDEATAALDTQTANMISGAILDLDNLTRIVVTHSLDEALLRRCDCILSLRSGKIAESGSFDELMQKKGYFYSLYTVSQ